MARGTGRGVHAALPGLDDRFDGPFGGRPDNRFDGWLERGPPHPSTPS
ncbi:hypothetical protein [Streptomyces sp. NPDC059076]